MSEGDREAWLNAAIGEVQSVPSFLFVEACQHARRTADHPAKIIPAIFGYRPAYPSPDALRRDLDDAERRLENIDAPRLARAAGPDDAERSEVAGMMADLRRSLSAAGAPMLKPHQPIPRPVRRYCPVCMFSNENPLVALCEAQNCGFSPDYQPGPLDGTYEEQEVAGGGADE